MIKQGLERNEKHIQHLSLNLLLEEAVSETEIWFGGQ